MKVFKTNATAQCWPCTRRILHYKLEEIFPFSTMGASRRKNCRYHRNRAGRFRAFSLCVPEADLQVQSVLVRDMERYFRTGMRGGFFSAGALKQSENRAEVRHIGFSQFQGADRY